MNSVRLIVLVVAAAVLAGVAWTGAQSSRPGDGPEMTLQQALRQRRSVRKFADTKLSAEQLLALAWSAQGVTDSAGHRTAPSAGATYPLELYVVSAEGVDHYRPDKNAFDRVGQGDLRAQLSAQACVKSAPATFVFAGVMERTTRKYGPRAQRYVYMEAGHAAQNLLLQAVALNLGGVPVGGFDESAVAKALNLPKDQEVLYMVPVGVPAAK